MSPRRCGNLSLLALLAVLVSACGGPLVLENVLLLPERRAESFGGLTVAPAVGALPRAGASGPVWLLGIDGMDWHVAAPMIARGELPVLAELVRTGASGVLRSELPTISPALWATIATGMPRHVHGVVNFVDKQPDSADVITVGPLQRRSPALWEFVGASGGESIVVGWFGSYPAERIFGDYVSKGYRPDSPLPDGIEPRSLAPELALRDALDVTVAERAAIGRTRFLSEQLDADASDLSNLHALLKTRSPQFVALHLSGIDVAQHLTWSAFEPLPGQVAANPDLADVIPAYYRWIDRQLGLLVLAAPDDATLLVLSDHGGQAIEPVQAVHLQLEVLLAEMGLLSGGDGELIAISELYRNEKRIWLNVVGGPVAAGDVVATAARVEKRLRLLETDLGIALVAQLTNHVGAVGWEPNDPAFTLLFADSALTAGWVMDGSARLDIAAVRLRHGDVSGGHRLDGLLAVRGPHVRPGAFAGNANQYQIAPTVLHLLGLPQDDRMLARAPVDGGVFLPLFRPAWLLANPVRGVPGYEGTDREALLDGRVPVPHPNQAEELERLRALGYVK